MPHRSSHGLQTPGLLLLKVRTLKKMVVLVLGEGRFLFVKQQGGRVEELQAWEGSNPSRKGPHPWHEEGGNKQVNRLRA